MRSVELAKVALASEGLRLRRLVRRQALRVAFGAGAAVFGIAVLVVLHFVIYLALTRWMSPLLSAVIVLVLDLIGVGVLAAMALRSVPDTVEAEARAIRVQSLIELRRSLTAMGMAAELGGAMFRSRTRAGFSRSMATMVAEAVSRVIGR